MKKTWILLCSGLLLTKALTTTYAASTNSTKEPIDQIVAIANAVPITQQQLDNAYQLAMQSIKAQGMTPPEESELKNAILNQLILQSLQIQLAQRNQLTIDKSELQKAINNIAKTHQLSLTALKQKITSQGLSFQQYEQNIRKQMLISKVQRRALAEDIQVSNTEAYQWLDQYKKQQKNSTQYHVIDFLVPLPSDPTPSQMIQAKQQAIHITQQLKKGTSSHAIQGGEFNDLGWKNASDLPDLFTESLKTMQPNDISQPLQAPNGFHVLQLVDIKKNHATLPTLNQAKHVLIEQKIQKALEKWLTQLRKRSYVKIIKPQQ